MRAKVVGIPPDFLVLSELTRLELWDAQDRYDAAAGELRTIAAAFAAAEKQAEALAPAVGPATEDANMVTTRLPLAQADRARAGDRLGAAHPARAGVAGLDDGSGSAAD